MPQEETLRTGRGSLGFEDIFLMVEDLMLGELGMPELLLILGIALLIFGPKKLGELGKSLGEGIRSFKSSLREPVAESIPVKSDEAK